jgi:transcriptional regulator GlxA family with amidase domain
VDLPEAAVDTNSLYRHAAPMSPKAAHSPPDAGRVVEVLAYPAVQLLDVTGPLQVFATANDLTVREGQDSPYDIRLVAPGGSSVAASSGVALVTSPLSAHDARIDTLVIAGGPDFDAISRDSVLIEWVRERSRQARRVAAICTGAFLLGAAGLLGGRRVATHWLYCDELARRFPDSQVEPDPIFLNDGQIWSSAGVTAGIDLALALVEEDLGRTLALAVARYLVVFLKRPGGQAQFSAALSLQASEDKFGGLHEWISAHLDEDLSLSVLANQARMSERSFSRHYAESTGSTPARAVERLRVEGARRLLLDTRLPVKRISQRCGFGSEETMRRSFQRLLNATPQDYRARFDTSRTSAR